MPCDRNRRGDSKNEHGRGTVWDRSISYALSCECDSHADSWVRQGQRRTRVIVWPFLFISLFIYLFIHIFFLYKSLFKQKKIRFSFVLTQRKEKKMCTIHGVKLVASANYPSHGPCWCVRFSVRYTRGTPAALNLIINVENRKSEAKNRIPWA